MEISKFKGRSLSLFKIENLGFEPKVLNSNQDDLISNQQDFKWKIGILKFFFSLGFDLNSISNERKHYLLILQNKNNTSVQK
jgi:hypothetical protein